MIPLGVLGSARVPPADYRTAVMADSPFGYWRHDETSGATSADETGTYPATWTGTYTRNASPLISTGKAVSLGGAGQASAAIGSYAPSSITVESVISISTTGGGPRNIVDRDDNATLRSFQFRVTSNQALEFIWWTVSSGPHFATSANSIISTSTPCHVAATYDSGVARVYKNGTQVATTTATNAALKGINFDLWMGCTRGANPAQQFNGVLDEQAAYPTALSAARILAHAQAGGFA